MCVLQYTHKCVIHVLMTGDEFYRKIRKIGQRNGIPVTLIGRHGKGSHGRLYYGDAVTTLKDRKKEIGPGLLRKCAVTSAWTQTPFEAECNALRISCGNPAR